MEKKYKPLFRRLIVFTATKVAKRTAAGLYVPNPKRETYSNLMRAWPVFMSEKCHTKWGRGQCVIAQDLFEFDDFPHSLWEEWRDAPEFAELKKFEEVHEAFIDTKILMEDSILAYEDEFRATDEIIYTKNYQHFVG